MTRLCIGLLALVAAAGVGRARGIPATADVIQEDPTPGEAKSARSQSADEARRKRVPAKARRARAAEEAYDFATGLTSVATFARFMRSDSGLATGSSSSSYSFASMSEAAPAASSVVLSSFDGTAAAGAVIAGTTWNGNVSQGAGFITVGGGARDDNGWGVTGLTLDLSGMQSLSIVAQRDSSFVGSLALQLEDSRLATHVISVSAISFSAGAPSLAQVAIGTWPSDFDPTQISSWSIGGGGLGAQSFQMSLHHVEFSASAIPEPATWGLAMGTVALALAGVLTRRRARTGLRIDT